LIQRAMGGLLPKPVTAKETEDGASRCGRWAFGVSSMQGWRRAMEDAHLALPDFDTERDLGLFGVFDGHGGGAVARVASTRLPATLKSLDAYKQGRYSDALYEAFLVVDDYLDSKAGRAEVAGAMEMDPEESAEDDEEEALKELIESGEVNMEDLKALEEEDAEEEKEDFLPDEEDEPEDANDAWANGSGPDGMGCTAVVALVLGGEKPQVICANAGDSRCLLMRGTKAKNMSKDHKPELKSELARIKKAGGFVSADGRVDGNLNLSRSLGDFAYKKDKSLKVTEQKISGEAEVKKQALAPADRYLAIGCDGIFEKFSSQRLTDFLTPRLRQRRREPTLSLSAVCSSFLDENIAVQPQKEQGLGCDNMTLLVVDLHADQKSSSRVSSPKKPALALGPKACIGKPRRTVIKDGVLPPPARRRRVLLGEQRRRSLHW